MVLTSLPGRKGTSSAGRRLVNSKAVRRRHAAISVTLGCVASAGGLPEEASAAIVDEEAAVEVFRLVAPSVVTIEDLMTVQGVDVEEGIGSGFVWDSFGHIVTNSHVISKVANDKTGTQVRFTTPLAA
jgi:S1-C subfamily serine protease